MKKDLKFKIKFERNKRILNILLGLAFGLKLFSEYRRYGKKMVSVHYNRLDDMLAKKKF